MRRFIIVISVLATTFFAGNSPAQVRPFAGNLGLISINKSADQPDVMRLVDELRENTPNQYDEDTNPLEEIRFFPHIVKGGESLGRIAKSNGINLGTIYSLNPKIREGKAVKNGVELILSNIDGQLYDVKPGDQLAKVAAKFARDRVSIEAIRIANQLPRKTNLIPGTRLFIPGAKMDQAEIRDRTEFQFVKPVSGGWISSKFSSHRVLVVKGRKQARAHFGTDIALPYGSPVRASRRGRVSFAGWMGGYGKLVILQHADGVETRYGHLSQIKVRTGQIIERDQQLGKVGSTGNSTGPHLHLEYRVNGVPKDPLKYIKGW